MQFYPESSCFFPPSSHICWFYETEEEHRTLATTFLLQGLEGREKVVYITDVHPVATIMGYLQDSGVDAEAAVARGQLLFLTSDEAYLQDGVFDPERMLALLQQNMRQALDEGYIGLRITGEMTWALREWPGSDQLRWYEAQVNNALSGFPCIALCQYDRRQFPPEVLQDLVWSHPFVAFGDRVYRNPHYLSPQELYEADPPQTQLQRWMDDLAERSQADDRIRHLSALLLAIRNVNQTIVREKDPQRLLQRICENLTDTRGYLSAWCVALDGEKMIAAGASGLNEEAFNTLKEQWLAGTIPGCARQALTDSAFVVTGPSQALCADCQVCLPLPEWRTLTLRLEHAGRVRGVLSVCSPARFAEDPMELGLLREVAEDIAFALHTIELENERRRMEEETRRLVVALRAVVRPARRMATILEEEALLQDVVKTVQAVTGAYNVNMFLRTEAGLVLAAGYGGYEDNRPPLGYCLELGQGIIGTVAQTGQPLLVPDVTQDPRYFFYENLPHTRSELAVPLKHGKRILGVLDVQATEPNAFDLVALEAITALANQLAVALENARLFSELARRVQELTALHDNALRLAAAGSLQELLSTILSRAMALLHGRGGGIYIYSSTGDKLEWVAGHGIGQMNVGVRLQPGEGLAGRVLQERRPLKVDNYASWEGRSPQFEGQILGAVAAVPLIWQEEIIGVLTISRAPEQAPFSDDDLRLLTLFGQQAAAAIATARFREALQRHADQVSIINEICQALAATLDLPTIYRTARDGIRRLVDAPIFGISLYDANQQVIIAAFMAEGEAELDISQFPPLLHVPDAPAGRSRAITTAQPEIISDLTYAYQEGKAIVIGDETHPLSALYVPMVVEGKVIGLLEMQSYRRAAYTSEEAALLQTVANQIGLSIQNARLYQEARQLAAFNAEIIRSMAEGIVITDEAGLMTFVNPAMAQLLGYEPQELVGQHWRFTVPPDQEPIIRAAMRRRRRGRIDRYELELLRKDGQRVPVLVSGVPRWDENGRFAGTLAVFTDISERKQAEEALQRYTERLQMLRTLDAAILAARSPEEVARVVLKHIRRWISCDGAGVVMLNRITSEAIVLAGEANRNIPVTAGFRFPLVDVDALIQASERGEVIFVPDIRALSPLPPPDALLLQVGVRAYIAAPLVADGELLGWIAIASTTPGAFTAEEGEILRELSAQLAIAFYQARLRAALGVEKARLAALVAHLPEGILLLDGENRILLTNPAADAILPTLTEARLGEKLTHLAGHPLHQLLNHQARGTWHEIVVPNHPQRIFLVALQPISEVAPEGGWVVVIREVTQERELQAQLEQQERLAAVGQLASGIAHDFNNLLATILLYAQMGLTDPRLPRDLSQHLEIIVGESQQATRLIQQVLDFSRRAPIEVQPLDLSPFLREMGHVLGRTIPERIRLRLHIGEGTFVVCGDPTRIRQAVINMVVNARDAIPAEGEIRLSLSRMTLLPGDTPPVMGMAPGDWVCLEVADTGTGIPPEVLPHIFEPFFTTKPRGLGTGLGLAQVYGIVQQHQGYIDVQTEVGKGTIFRVYLPAYEEKTVYKEMEGAPEVLVGRGETILLVEDHPTLRAAGREMLEQLGYRVLEAGDGRQALEIYAAEKVDLIITDVVMPGMGGASLVETLRAQNPHLKVIAVTGYGEDKEVERIRRAGVQEVIRKPFEVERLARIIRRVLEETPGDAG